MNQREMFVEIRDQLGEVIDLVDSLERKVNQKRGLQKLDKSDKLSAKPAAAPSGAGQADGGDVSRADEAQNLFDLWVKETKREPSRTRLTASRKNLILRRLRDYPASELAEAIKGIANSPFHRGSNPQQKRYDTIEVCFRDAAHIEGFIDDHRGVARSTWDDGFGGKA